MDRYLVTRSDIAAVASEKARLAALDADAARREASALTWQYAPKMSVF